MPAVVLEPTPTLALAPSLRERPAAYGVIAKCLSENRGHTLSGLGQFFGVRPVQPNARSWFVGAIGELAVGRILSKLGPDWTVLHSVPIGAGESDVDHLLIGPAGVFALNTKHHARKSVWVSDGRILVDGQKVDHLRNSRSERVKVQRMLELATETPVPVEAMLVFVGSESLRFNSRPSDVTVLTAGKLLRHLAKRKPKLTPAEVQKITDAATAVRTWHPTASGTFDPAILEQFAALRRASSVALTRRVACGAALTLAILGAVWAFGPAVVQALVGLIPAV